MCESSWMVTCFSSGCIPWLNVVITLPIFCNGGGNIGIVDYKDCLGVYLCIHLDLLTIPTILLFCWSGSKSPDYETLINLDEKVSSSSFGKPDCLMLPRSTHAAQLTFTFKTCLARDLASSWSSPCSNYFIILFDWDRKILTMESWSSLDWKVFLASVSRKDQLLTYSTPTFFFLTLTYTSVSTDATFSSSTRGVKRRVDAIRFQIDER